MTAWSSLLQYRMISYLKLSIIAPLRFDRILPFVRIFFRRRFLGLRHPREPVRREYTTDLFDLIRLCLAAAWLEIEDLCYVIASEDVVIAADTLVEAQVVQQCAQVTKSNI